MFNEFLPTDYDLPKTQGNYLRLQDGENKIRIISKPIVGWEEWYEKAPIRHRMDAKPATSRDPKSPLRHFWAMLVFDYFDSKIKIFHITQATILREFSNLIQDKDWGSPFNYDIKIRKSGKEMQTKYSVNPMPHKPCSQDIKDLFHVKQCYLEALFDSLDPFDTKWTERTPGHFGDLATTEKATLPETITGKQLVDLLDLIGDDKGYLKTLEANCFKHFNIFKIADLPASKYDAVMASVAIYVKERDSKKAVKEELPF